MKIPNSLVPIAYTLAKGVYEGEISRRQGQRELVGDNRINPNSAADYLDNFRALREGKRFTRTLNTFSTKYFLNQIHKDYGDRGLSLALKALEEHIKYYESSQHTTMRANRNLIRELKVRLQPGWDPDEQEQAEILRVYEQNNVSKKEIIAQLKALKPSDPKEITYKGKKYKRDNETIALIKHVRGHKCQICGQTIQKRNGSFYIEGAHIIPKHEKGAETPENIILLCPNHHKEFDLGDRQILFHDKEIIRFRLNGKVFSIPLKVE